jgi:hypothetical protein
LLAWEEDLVGECRYLLSNITLQDIETDIWQWCPTVGDGYTVCGVYQMLMRQEMHSYNEALGAVWHKIVPLKVSICVWRLLRNRLSTKDNLVRRGIITNESQ